MFQSLATIGTIDCFQHSCTDFQDLVQLVNSDQPFWLNGLTEMSKTFGLQLLDSILVKFPSIFFNVRN